MGVKNMSLVDRYRRWFDYEVDSHLKTLNSLGAVSQALHDRPEYTKALALMTHIVTARRLWLHRLGALAEGPLDLFPDPPPLIELKALCDATESLWRSLLTNWEDADLARIVEYRSLEGSCYRNSVEEILTQLFGHSWYHRGQIAVLVRSLGAEPAVTDFIFWSRREIPALD